MCFLGSARQSYRPSIRAGGQCGARLAGEGGRRAADPLPRRRQRLLKLGINLRQLDKELQCKLQAVCLMAIEQTALESSHYDFDSGFGGVRRSGRDAVAFVLRGGGVSFIGGVECLLDGL